MIDPDLTCMTIFCEKARQEVEGQVTLVGIFPDNIQCDTSSVTTQEPGQALRMPSLCVYTRIRLPIDRDVKSEILVHFRTPSGQPIFDGEIEQEFIVKSIDEARVKGNEYVLLVQQAEMPGFPILENGRFRVTVVYGGNEYFSGAINFEGAHLPN